MLKDHARNHDWSKSAQRWKALLTEREQSLSRIKSGLGADSPERHEAAMKRAQLFTPIASQENDAARRAGLRQLLDIGAAERVIGRADFEPPAFLELGLAVSRGVCLVTVHDRWGHPVASGTGFLVSPGVMLTNNHVILSFEEASRSRVTFDFRTDPQGRDMATTSFALDPGKLFLTDVDRDCTFVAVGARDAGARSLGDYPWLPLSSRSGKLEVGDPVYIIQHPAGERLQFVLRENKLLLLPHVAHVKDPDLYAHYEADTLQGSSGAPVLSRFWEVVALHHQAVPDTDADGRILGLDGEPYYGSDDTRVRWIGNEGIRVSALLRYLDEVRGSLTGGAAELMTGVLSGERPDYVGFAQRALTTTVSSTASRPESDHMSDSIEITIPLTLSLRFGAAPASAGALPIANVAAPGSSAAGLSGETGSTSPTTRSLSPAATPASPELQQQRADAFAELEASRRRKYYDNEADSRDRGSFYDGFEPGSDGQTAFEHLAELLTRSHHTKPRYSPSKHVYPWVDLHEEDGELVIKSIYSGNVYDAAEFLDEAFRIEARREALRRNLRANESFAVVPEAALEDLMEANAPYNCEHVVPQSWFSKKEPMRGDLHHLFACESGCNSFRGNHAYDQFAPDEAYRDMCGRRETNRFEPTAGKGAVARATFYFLLRYPGGIDLDLSLMDADRIARLKDWHAGDPVSIYERHRNQAIFAAQGNRNPLIDFPDWVDAIDWTAGLEGI